MSDGERERDGVRLRENVELQERVRVAERVAVLRVALGPVGVVETVWVRASLGVKVRGRAIWRGLLVGGVASQACCRVHGSHWS